MLRTLAGAPELLLTCWLDTADGPSTQLSLSPQPHLPCPPPPRPALQAIWRARALPPGACTAGGVDLPRLLFTFARREWKQGDAAQGARLAREVLEAEPGNPYALGLLAHIAAEAGQVGWPAGCAAPHSAAGAGCDCLAPLAD